MKIEQIVEQPVIEAGRFVLRPLRKSDAGLIHMYASDERVARGTRSIPHPLPPGATEAYVARGLASDRAEDIWVMDGAAHGLSEVLGLVGLERMDRAQSEIGYWVAPALWNTGLASEAVQAVVPRTRTLEDALRRGFPGQSGLGPCLTNAGFDYIGDAEAFSVARNAKVPTWTYIRNMG
jgi:RimJ/RimL family protein N-acetyltransferase